jgi:hypothetical protein
MVKISRSQSSDMFGKTEFIDLFEIRLDKQQYKTGEKVKGTLVISSRNDFLNALI